MTVAKNNIRIALNSMGNFVRIEVDLEINVDMLPFDKNGVDH